MLIGGFVIIVTMKDIFLKIRFFVIDRVETSKVITIFLNFFESLLDGKRKVFYNC